jgi:hypothetical protein
MSVDEGLVGNLDFHRPPAIEGGTCPLASRKSEEITLKEDLNKIQSLRAPGIQNTQDLTKKITCHNKT